MGCESSEYKFSNEAILKCCQRSSRRLIYNALPFKFTNVMFQTKSQIVLTHFLDENQAHFLNILEHFASICTIITFGLRVRMRAYTPKICGLIVENVLINHQGGTFML